VASIVDPLAITLVNASCTIKRPRNTEANHRYLQGLRISVVGSNFISSPDKSQTQPTISLRIKPPGVILPSVDDKSDKPAYDVYLATTDAH
jgi:hypothetical protein